MWTGGTDDYDYGDFHDYQVPSTQKEAVQHLLRLSQLELRRLHPPGRQCMLGVALQSVAGSGGIKAVQVAGATPANGRSAGPVWVSATPEGNISSTATPGRQAVEAGRRSAAIVAEASSKGSMTKSRIFGRRLSTAAADERKSVGQTGEIHNSGGSSAEATTGGSSDSTTASMHAARLLRAAQQEQRIAQPDGGSQRQTAQQKYASSDLNGIDLTSTYGGALLKLTNFSQIKSYHVK